MSEQRFDPMTGEPINPDSADQQPVNQPTYGNSQTYGNPQQPFETQQPIYGTQSGQTYGAQQQSGAQQPTYGTQQPYVTQQPYGMQQGNPYAYDPAAIEKAQSDKNKKLALIAVGVGGVLFLILLVSGIFWAAKTFEKKLPDQDAEQNTSAEVEEPVEIPAETIEDEPVKEEPVEDTDEDSPEYDLQLQEIEEPDLDSILGENNSEEEIESEETNKVNSSTEVSANDPNSVYSFQIGDDQFSIPCKVSEFLDKGWTLKDDNTADSTLGFGEYDSYELYYPGSDSISLSVCIMNFDVNVQAVKDSYVTEAYVFLYNAESIGVEVTSHNGDLVVGKSTKEEIIAAFGEPTKITERSGGEEVICYEGEHDFYDEVGFFMNESGVIEFIHIENYYAPEDFTVGDVNDEVPDYLSKYEAPKSLGTDPLSGNFKMDDVVFNLPLPYTEMIDKGWKNKSDDPELIIGAHERYDIYLSKGDRYFSAVAYNPSDTATYLKYTMVIEVYVSDGNHSQNIELPGGLSMSMTEDELKEYLTKNNITNYEYDRGSERYEIPLDQSGNDRRREYDRCIIDLYEGKIDTLELKNYGWLNN